MNIKALKSSKPLFISFEGGEGVGKTTQMNRLEKLFEENQIAYVRTREPGGCRSALDIRKLLLEGEDDRWDGISESLMYTAARNENLRKIIRPALASGRWVLCDRFADSTTVYQGMGRGIDRGELLKLHNLVVKNTWPDLTIILDNDVEKGLARQKRSEAQNEVRFENLGNEFHQKVRKGFLQIAQENPQRCRVVDATTSIAEVFADIMAEIEKFVESRGEAA